MPEPFSVEEAQDSSQSRSQPDHLEIDDADDSALTEGKLQLPDDDQVVEDEDDASMEGVSKPDDESQAPDSAESTTEIKLPLDQKVSSTPADYSQEDLVVHLLEKLSTLSISQDSSDFVVVARLIATQLLILRHSQKSALAVELTINGDEWTHLIEATNDF